MIVCVMMFRGLRRTVRSGAPFVPLYSQKPARCGPLTRWRLLSREAVGWRAV